MARTIVLDASPLSIVTMRRGVPEAEGCRQWVVECRVAGWTIRAPAIAYFEVARELRRAGNSLGLERLEAFCSLPGCYLPLTDSALRLAARLWADARNAGAPTADPKELDCDVLIAAQALELGGAEAGVVIATMNVGHLARFVPAEHWRHIAP